MLVVVECVVCDWLVVYWVDVGVLVLDNGLGLLCCECVSLVLLVGVLCVG